MNQAHQLAARELLDEFFRQRGLAEPARPEEVRQFVQLLERTAQQEREACAAIADQVMGAFGSHAAEMVGVRIRQRTDS